ncbi:protein KRI1 homolog isoform X2 [Lytechinus variegatus]|uniref:protein KRI1 homolog isoform X2 n=2 Tax=Lytechinus variegatus TaxID=7654 RepID=UPI001BB22E1F|nr:protein KRI1 homolog isoform X2 [Lytechinus variegatus]
MLNFRSKIQTMADETVEFGINKNYAQNYNIWRRKEEMQKYKDKYGDYDEGDESSSSETEDEDAEGLTPQIEKDFFKTLSIIKSRDPKMYTKDIKFYHSEDSGSDDNQQESSRRPKQNKESSRKDKPMYLKDYERKIIVEKEGMFTDDIQGSEEEIERAMSPTYAEEQQHLKESFFSAVQEEEEEDDGILTVKKKSKLEEEEEEGKYIEWLKQEEDTLGQDDADTAELNPLRKYWTNPALDDGEKFLRDFILNKGYIDKEQIGRDGFNMDDQDGDDEEDEMEEEDFSEEERQLEEQEDFERKYNFRYEEPDSDFIKRYPRTVAESVRRKDSSRAEKRQEKKTRKEQVKQKKKEELKHLKNLKKQEIMERIDKLKEVTGNEKIGFDPDDLEGDFDPTEHDRLMQKVFSGEYEAEEEHAKPQFANEEDFEEENWDDWTRANLDTDEDYNGYQEYDDEQYEQDTELNYDDPDFNMDADYIDPSQKPEQSDLASEMLGASRKKRKKMSLFAKSLVKKKPIFNPDKSFEDYIEEYYRLDYEDMIGDLPCRFKYRTVPPNNFGLTTDEILRSREKELNQWVSLKKTCQYRSEEEEKRDILLFQKMAQNEGKKKRIFLSMHEERDSEDTEDADNAQSRTLSESKHIGLKQGGRKQSDCSSYSMKPSADSRKTKEMTHIQNDISPSDAVGVQTTVSLNGRNILKPNRMMAADKESLENEESMGDTSSSKLALSSREKKKQRKREILARLKALKTRKKVKQLDRMRGRVKVGAGTVSEARLKAYGINPKKHMYRMKNEIANK